MAELKKEKGVVVSGCGPLTLYQVTLRCLWMLSRTGVWCWNLSGHIFFFFFLSERNSYWEICQLSWVCSKARGDLRTTNFSAGLVGSERPGSGVGFKPIAWAPSLTLGFQAPWLCVFCLRFFVCLFLAQMLFLPVLTDKSSISVSHYRGAWSLWAPD